MSASIHLGIANEVETAGSQSQLMLLILIVTTPGLSLLSLSTRTYVQTRRVTNTSCLAVHKHVTQTMRDSISTPHAHFVRPIQYTCGTYECTQSHMNVEP
jgi:hypothetical protein